MAEYPQLDPPETVGPAPGQGFILHLMFQNGLQIDRIVTLFDPLVINGKIISAKVEQHSALPGDDLVAYVDWSEVVLAEVRSIEPGGRHA